MSDSNGRSRRSQVRVHLVPSVAGSNGARLPITWVLSLLLVGTMLLLAACGSAEEAKPQGASTAPAAVETPAQAATVEEAPVETQAPTEASAPTEAAAETAAPTEEAIETEEEAAETEEATEEETPTPDLSSSKLDPCELFTREDAEGALGGPLPESERTVVGPFDSCMYSDGTWWNTAQFQVASSYYTKDNFDEQMKAAAGMVDEKEQAVSGVGDGAYWLGGVLYVLAGDYTLSFLVVTPDQMGADDAKKEQALQKSLQISTDLAKKVIPRLP